MGFASAGLELAAGGVQMFGQLGAGRAQRALGNAEAKLLQRDADVTMGQAAVEQDRERRQGSHAAASQRALLAARGLDPSMGSAALVADDIAGASMLNRLNIHNQALARATALRGQARIAQFRGRLARDQSLVDANVTFLRSNAQAARSFGF